MDDRNLVTKAPSRRLDKIFKKVPVTSVTVTSGDTSEVNGYSKTISIPHPYGKTPNVYLEHSLDRSRWFPVGSGRRSVTSNNIYQHNATVTWQSGPADVTLTAYAHQDFVPLTIYYRAVLYANT